MEHIKYADRIEYKLNGKLSAIESSDGTKYWYINDKRHREDGPAVESSVGTKEWYLNGNCHREDGPAVEYSDGTKCWYRAGKCRRVRTKSTIVRWDTTYIRI
jgi:hypothetical protein